MFKTFSIVYQYITIDCRINHEPLLMVVVVVLRHFQQYFSYIVAFSFIRGENYHPGASHWQTWSDNAVLGASRLSEIRTHNVSGNRHWWHR